MVPSEPLLKFCGWYFWFDAFSPQTIWSQGWEIHCPWCHLRPLAVVAPVWRQQLQESALRYLILAATAPRDFVAAFLGGLDHHIRIWREYVVSRQKMVIIVQKLGFEKKNGTRVFQTEANVVKTNWATWERSQATCSWALSGSNSLAGSSSAWSPSRSSAVAEEMIKIGHNCSNPSHLHITYWQCQKATNLLVSDKAFYAKISVRHLSCSACSSCFCSSSSWT